MSATDPALLSLFCARSRVWYDAPWAGPPDPAFLRVLRSKLPCEARIVRQGPFLHVLFQLGQPELAQGWKIHISSTPADAEKILSRAIPILANSRTAFKVQSDRRALVLANSRGVPRGSSGKFITIYPRTTELSAELLEALDGTLGEHRGPRVLSDRQYRASSVLHYRYGGFAPLARLEVTGVRTPHMTDPSGQPVPDPRKPYWSPPEWVSDPFSERNGESAAAGDFLLNSRYRVREAKRFTNSGGIYLADDQETSEVVLIKEARPHTDHGPSGMDAVALRLREFEILTRLVGRGIAPEPVEVFTQDDHVFLVVEYIPDAVHLLSWITARNPLLTGGGSFREYRETLHGIWVRAAESLADLHGLGIVYGDLSLTNILVKESVEPGTVKVLLTDFEAAYDASSMGPTGVFTYGLAPRALREGAPTGFPDDVYSLGMLILATIVVATEPSIQERGVMQRLLDNVSRDLSLPPEFASLVSKLTADEPASRPTALEACEAIKAVDWTQATPDPAIPSLLPPLSKIVAGIHEASDYSRSDRCYPADPMVYETNPLSVAYGAAGVLRGLRRAEGAVPPAAEAWLLQHNISAEDYPPGLYVGMAGIAWELWELGLPDYALTLLHVANEHPLVGTTSSLFCGDAGLGLANLHLWNLSAEVPFLETAIRLGDSMLKLDSTTASAAWSAEDGRLGLAYGPSGVATFLLYLALAAGETQYSELGARLMEFELRHGVDTGAGYRAIPGSTDPDDRIVSPYWLSGAAGTGAAVLRYVWAGLDHDWDSWLHDFVVASSRKYTFMPGYVMGLAGLGDFLLDVYYFTGRPEALDGARLVAEGASLFARGHGDGVIFPGQQLMRCSADFATGSAGILAFLHRLGNVANDPGSVQLLPGGILQRDGTLRRSGRGSSNMGQGPV